MAVAGKRKPTSRNVHDVGLNDDSIVGVFGLTASYSLLLRRLTSKLADVLVVGVAGFEPTTSSSRTKRATRLRYTPKRERGLYTPVAALQDADKKRQKSPY